jgi:anti-sigma regulatory factor (Ser/Thr protein kinase)
MMELPADPVSAARARQMVVGAARRSSRFCEMDVDDLCVAVGEAFANAVRHGGRTPSHSIQFGVEVHAEGLRVRMAYPSAPFNTAPALPDPEDLCPGGYGLHLMRALADVVDFHFENGTARLCLEKTCRRCKE